MFAHRAVLLPSWTVFLIPSGAYVIPVSSANKSPRATPPGFSCHTYRTKYESKAVSVWFLERLLVFSAETPCLEP